jgi:hypothetical protein
MAAFYSFGSQVENQMGSLVMLGQTILFVPLIGVCYMIVETVAAKVTKDIMYEYSCAVGFSGVIFAYLVVHTALQIAMGVNSTRLCGINIPIFIYPLVILALISLFMPNISFAGHLSGVIIAFLYVKGLFQILTLPRGMLLGIQNWVPQWLTSKPCWRAVAVEDPLKPLHFAFLRNAQCECVRVADPEHPERGGCGSCFLGCIQSVSRRWRGRRGQASGYAAAPAAGRAAAAQAGGGRPGARIPQNSRLLEGPARSFPALPASMAPSAPPSEERDRSSSNSSQGHVHDSAAARNGDYAQLVNLHEGGEGDDIEMQSYAQPAPPAPRASPPRMPIPPPPRALEDISPRNNAPLLDPSVDQDLELARQHAAARAPDL